MATEVRPGSILRITSTTIVTLSANGNGEIFGAAADQITPLENRVTVEIQNRNGAPIQVITDDTAAAGRFIGANAAWIVDMDPSFSSDGNNNLYIVGGGATICVTELGQ